ncbi:hypothetical protein [Streptomyces sp. NPDC051452]|uniref:hypothetical protein n=1 Tax=Streptomyces sp. NPDC051452 TaxID=3365654 RepID=UPI0037B2AC4E
MEARPTAGLDALARVQQRIWDSIAEQSEDRWATPTQLAAQAWNEHRRSQS